MIDMFLFNNEMDLLEIRLNSLAPFVERFVLSEMPITFTGKSKPLYFSENKDKFKDFNITHLVVTGYKKFTEPLDREGYQRNYLIHGIMDVDPETMILLSDVDEIPDLRRYRGGDEGVFRQRVYHYGLNVYTGHRYWKGTIAMKKKHINAPLDSFRDRIASQRQISRNKRIKTVVIHGGWHFSSVGSVKQITEKIESCCTQRYNTPEFKARIKEKRNSITSWIGDKKYTIDPNPGPRWLRVHRGRYRHLYYGTRQWARG